MIEVDRPRLSSLCESLTAEGVDVTMLTEKPIDFPERTVEKEVKQRGLKSYEGFKLNRYFAPRDCGFLTCVELRHMCHKNMLILSMQTFPTIILLHCLHLLFQERSH